MSPSPSDASECFETRPHRDTWPVPPGHNKLEMTQQCEAKTTATCATCTMIGGPSAFSRMASRLPNTNASLRLLRFTFDENSPCKKWGNDRWQTAHGLTCDLDSALFHHDQSALRCNFLVQLGKASAFDCRHCTLLQRSHAP